MKKVLFITIAMVGLIGTSWAQQKQRDPALDGNKIGIGAEFSLPNGDFGDAYPVGFGGSLNYIHAINQKFKLTGYAGFLSFTGKEMNVSGTTFKPEPINLIPVKVGARYYFVDNFYASGELGTGFSTTSKNSKLPFLYSPGLGVEFPVSDKMTVDFSGRYDGLTRDGVNNSFIGIRAALNFGL